MKTFNVKFTREFEVSIEADTLEIAGQKAKHAIAQFPDPCTLISIAEQKEMAGVVSPPA